MATKKKARRRHVVRIRNPFRHRHEQPTVAIKFTASEYRAHIKLGASLVDCTTVKDVQRLTAALHKTLIDFELAMVATVVAPKAVKK